jgi:hypothetical protein
MKRALSLLIAGTILLGLVGCASEHGIANRPLLNGLGHGTCRTSPELCQTCPGDPACRACGGRGCALCSRLCASRAPDPMTGVVAYPYYTLHGPRDYFVNNPPSIGP